jgi:hypothetical protein
MNVRWPVALAMIVCGALLSGSSALGQQQFELVERSGLVSGVIEVAPGRLLVHERTGERILYSRDPSYDSGDRRFAGYFNATLQRVLRFPRSGSGVLQVADLDDLEPRYLTTTRVVRRVGSGPPGGAWQGGLGHAAHLPLVPGYPVNVIPPIDTPYPPAFPYPPGFPATSPLPQSVLIDSTTIPNPPLPPALVQFRNDGPRDLQVAIIDSQNPSGSRTMRIAPAAAAEVELERDAGATRVSHYWVITPLGETVTREVVNEIPAPLRYEVVVHQWQVQSVAIDRTGKSPNPIEDINFQGRGIGRFPLPPGPELQSGVIDVYRAAVSQQNPGAVAPIVPAEDLPSDDGPSPLERAILEAQRAAQGK